MAQYETVAVPFKTFENYRILTDDQLIEMPWLREFIAAFPHCFERDELRFHYRYLAD